MIKRALEFHTDKSKAEIIHKLDFLANTKDTFDSERELQFVKHKRKNNYSVYYRYREPPPSSDRFGFNIDEPYFKHHYFIAEVSEQDGKCKIIVKIIDDTRLWNIIKLAVFAPLMSLVIMSGMFYVLQCNELNATSVLAVIGSVAVTYLFTVLNITFNKEDVSDFDNNALPLLIGKLNISQNKKTIRE
ncbi:MAG: hypothetical protein ACI396_05555 [Acutalibacteraceae bacterium]